MAHNSFQSLIADRTISVAKAHGHEHADAPHVLVVIAKTVLDPSERNQRSQALEQQLPPNGASIKRPVLTSAAEAMIERCKDARSALNELDGAPEISAGPFVITSEEAQDSIDDPATGKSVADKKKSTSELIAELDSLVGLNEAKKQLRKVMSVVEANRIRSEAGAKPVPQSLHLVFTGNPGTGKTTVARILAQLYGASGALKGDKFREATRGDLIAGYVGHTATQTERVLKSVQPGVLFIDEAYSLKPSHFGDFAEECISTLVKSMEDNRSNLAIIAAGYKEEMSEFINSNPGLRSRFQTFIHFDDYAPDELVAIYQRFAEEASIRLAEGVEGEVREAIQRASNQTGFGNARFVRALWEESYANMAVRAAFDGVTTSAELEEIVSGDVPSGNNSAIGLKRKIGF